MSLPVFIVFLPFEAVNDTVFLDLSKILLNVVKVMSIISDQPSNSTSSHSMMSLSVIHMLTCSCYGILLQRVT